VTGGVEYEAVGTDANTGDQAEGRKRDPMLPVTRVAPKSTGVPSSPVTISRLADWF